MSVAELIRPLRINVIYADFFYLCFYFLSAMYLVNKVVCVYIIVHEAVAHPGVGINWLGKLIVKRTQKGFYELAKCPSTPNPVCGFEKKI